VKFDSWDEGYDHVLQPLQEGGGELVVTPLITAIGNVSRTV